MVSNIIPSGIHVEKLFARKSTPIKACRSGKIQRSSVLGTTTKLLRAVEMNCEVISEVRRSTAPNTKINIGLQRCTVWEYLNDRLTRLQRALFRLWYFQILWLGRSQFSLYLPRNGLLFLFNLFYCWFVSLFLSRICGKRVKNFQLVLKPISHLSWKK